MQKIMFTGGGSAGHVTENIALLPRFIEEGSTDHIGRLGESTERDWN